jgi:hypothetical protein
MAENKGKRLKKVCKAAFLIKKRHIIPSWNKTSCSILKE